MLEKKGKTRRDVEISEVKGGGAGHSSVFKKKERKKTHGEKKREGRKRERQKEREASRGRSRGEERSECAWVQGSREEAN